MTKPASRFDRREFLGQSGSASIGSLLGGKLSLNLLTGGVAAGTVLTARPCLYAQDKPETPKSADVGIARGSNMEEAVFRAAELAGGVDFIKADQTVLIKPNCTGAAANPTTTSPEVLYAVIKLVASRGPKRILVSDRSFSPLFNTKTPKTIDVMKRVGHLDAVNQAIADFKAPVVAVGLEDAAEEFEKMGLPADTPHWRKMNPPLAKHWPEGFELAELLMRVDHIINVPVIKTHFQAWFTMSMKAFVGMSHHRSRREFHMSFRGSSDLFDQLSPGRKRRRGRKGREEAIDEVTPMVNRIAELNLGVTPALNIMDGTRSFVFGGPSQGDTAEPKLVVASRDRIAADATGVAVLRHLGTEERLQKFSVWDNPFIKHAMKIGLGIDGPEKLNLKDHGVEEIDEIRELLA
jgi:uncharacterized protein (DUF362 family)